MAPAGRLEGPHEPDSGPQGGAGGADGRPRSTSGAGSGGRGRQRARLGPSRGRAPRRARWILAALLLVPLVEIVVIIAVGQQIGPWWTFVALLGLTLVGAWLVRREGSRTWRRLQEAVRSGQPPARELTDAGLVLIGGILLLTPGFVTGIIGLFLILPFTRPLTRVWVQRLVSSRLLFVSTSQEWTVRGGRWRPASGGDVIEGEVVSDEERDPPAAGGATS
jgi:UPF0716 protein FxsA